MKRTVLIILSILFILTACAEKTTQTEGDTDPSASEATDLTLPPPVLTGDEDTFYLSYLPDIGEYEGEEAPERWYSDYVGGLIPSDAYGALIPYLGYEKEFEEFSYGEWGVRKQRYYGLCTTDGVIVTDPVYSAVYMGAEGYYILKGQPAEVELEYYSDYLYPFYIAKSDGSEVNRLSVYAAGCRHLAYGIYYTTESYVDSSGLKMHDREGNLIRDTRAGDDYYYWIPDVNPDGTMTEEHNGTEYFINDRLECTSAVFKRIEYVDEGVYLVEELDGGCGIIDINGEYIVPCEYDMLEITEFGFVSLKGDLVEVKDRDMNTLHSFTVDYAVKEISVIGPSVINVIGDKKVWDNHFYSLDGRTYEYNEVQLLHRERAYYCFAGEESTLITDIDLNEVVSFQRSGIVPLYFYNVAPGYVALRDTETEAHDIMLYDVKEGDLTEGISDVHEDYYTVVAEDGTESYYDYDGNVIQKPEENVTVSDTWVSAETPYGEIRMYIDGDYAYTEDAEGNVIVKRRAVFD